jgi:hypothetical protein
MRISANIQPAASPAPVVGVHDDPIGSDPTTRTVIVGLSALVFSTLYLLSDVIEAIQGGFSASQLWMTLVAEAVIPVVVVGLCVVQRPPSGDWAGSVPSPTPTATSSSPAPWSTPLSMARATTRRRVG